MSNSLKTHAIWKEDAVLIEIWRIMKLINDRRACEPILLDNKSLGKCTVRLLSAKDFQPSSVATGVYDTCDISRW